VSSTKLPKDVIAHWPEIFGEIEVKAIPLEYLESVNITFEDGNIWVIDLNEDAKNENPDELGEGIEDLLEEYEDVIVNIDFKVDVRKIKKDITARTHRFLKKRK
jgi:hypothetical protein